MGNLLTALPENDLLRAQTPVSGHSQKYDEVNNWVISQWSGFVTKQNLMVSANNALQLLLQNHCPNLLIDHTNVHGTWADFTDWLQNIWMPGLVNAGVKKYAHVAPSGSYSAMHAEELYSRINNQLEMMIFSSLQDAQNWLRSY